MENAIVIISMVLICFGLLFFLGSAVGIQRFPDFYTRMHAAGKGDTLSSLLVILGFAVFQIHDLEFSGKWISENWVTLLVMLKLLAICAFIMITSPTSTHALMDAGWEDGIEPVLKKDKPNNALKEDQG
ncbi:monovalent cation/H(+) antiporter subunit G [Verrucomicrobiales bacterium]|nr:monovalent cation/H(+) antiporter subunit G [Verrucomicrobiales bacterium]MDC0292235.1 monovalent cation/H(+) antiporter subunit G [Verrucomicrobiales bacterium]MDC0322779.1 monovalent cation/H(+) antiporter subunit G [Verrucomicrobiales bacterium]